MPLTLNRRGNWGHVSWGRWASMSTRCMRRIRPTGDPKGAYQWTMENYICCPAWLSLLLCSQSVNSKPLWPLFRCDGLFSAFTERNSEKGPISGAQWDSRKQKQLESRSRDHRGATSSSQILMSDWDITQLWKQHHGAWINSVGVPEMLVMRKLVEGLGFLRPSGQELRHHSCCIIKKCGFIVSFKTGEGWKFGL